MLNGKDDISVQLIDAFGKNVKLAQIAEQFHLSLDQVKRIKRFYNYSVKVHSLVGTELGNVFESLGTKGIALSKYIRTNNSDALQEILSIIPEQITRDELSLVIRKYDDKNERIVQFEKEYKELLIAKEQWTTVLNEKIFELEQLKANAVSRYSTLNTYNDKVHELLIYFVTPYKNGYALRRRLDSGFRRSLEKNNVLRLNDEYVWELSSIDDFAIALEKRLKRGHYIFWDKDRESARGTYTNTESYQAIRTHDQEISLLENEIQELQHQLGKMNNESVNFKERLKGLRAAYIQSFEESGIASNLLSEREILNHKRLQSVAMKWLYRKGYIVASEVELPNKRIADVVGIKDGHVVIIEVKVSYEDYSRDEKWPEYLHYCDDFYFLSDFYIENKSLAGVLLLKNDVIIEVQENRIKHQCQSFEQVTNKILRVLSRKYIFGY